MTHLRLFLEKKLVLNALHPLGSIALDHWSERRKGIAGKVGQRMSAGGGREKLGDGGGTGRV